MAFKMKGNPMKLGSIASKSTMKLKDKVMKMKKEAAMKMKKESMAKMKEAMAKMKKDPMMMKKGSPMEMKKGESSRKISGADTAKKAGKTIKDLVTMGPARRLAKGLKKAASEGMSEAAQKRSGNKMKKGEAMKMKKGEAMKMKKGEAMKMKKGQPMKQKMNMVKGPDGKMVPDFAVDGKGANDLKKSGAKMKKAAPTKILGKVVKAAKKAHKGLVKGGANVVKKAAGALSMKKKSPNKGRFIKAMKAGDFKSAGKILKREGKAIVAGSKATASGAANPTLAGTKTSFDIGYKEEKKRQAKKPVKITKRKPIKVGKTTISFRGEGDKPKTKS